MTERRGDSLITIEVFLREMGLIHEKIEQKHASLRTTMEQNFSMLEAQLDGHVREDLAVERRVQRMEDRREIEDRQTVRRSTYLALLISASFTAAWQIILKMWKGQ